MEALPEVNPVLRALSTLLLHLVDSKGGDRAAAAPPPRRPGPPLRVRWVRPDQDKHGCS